MFFCLEQIEIIYVGQGRSPHIPSPLATHLDGRTDGRTDGQTDEDFIERCPTSILQ